MSDSGISESQLSGAIKLGRRVPPYMTTDGQYKFNLIQIKLNLRILESRVTDKWSARRFARFAESYLDDFPDDMTKDIREDLEKKFPGFKPRILDPDDQFTTFWDVNRQESEYWLDFGRFILHRLTQAGKEYGIWLTEMKTKGKVIA
jgi:hypothetical protein